MWRSLSHGAKQLRAEKSNSSLRPSTKEESNVANGGISPGTGGGDSRRAQKLFSVCLVVVIVAITMMTMRITGSEDDGGHRPDDDDVLEVVTVAADDPGNTSLHVAQTYVLRHTQAHKRTKSHTHTSPPTVEGLKVNIFMFPKVRMHACTLLFCIALCILGYARAPPFRFKCTHAKQQGVIKSIRVLAVSPQPFPHVVEQLQLERGSKAQSSMTHGGPRVQNPGNGGGVDQVGSSELGRSWASASLLCFAS